MIEVYKIEKFKNGELEELTSATMNAIEEGIGFGWVEKPPKNRVKSYWQGVLLVPNRWLFIGKLKGVVAGSIQVVSSFSSNEVALFRVTIDNHFVATWARGHGLAKSLMESAEKECIKNRYTHILLDVRETQNRAIRLYEQMGYVCWGSLPIYHKLENNLMVSGKFYYKSLEKQ
ncbi:MAG: GNAT family N-acetyltransferase [Rickettsiales bacterium]|nr:GNAT family N-acetyltransferase [Rickettsiales bacterium]